MNYYGPAGIKLTETWSRVSVAFAADNPQKSNVLLRAGSRHTELLHTPEILLQFNLFMISGMRLGGTQRLFRLFRAPSWLGFVGNEGGKLGYMKGINGVHLFVVDSLEQLRFCCRELTVRRATAPEI